MDNATRDQNPAQPLSQTPSPVQPATSAQPMSAQQMPNQPVQPASQTTPSGQISQAPVQPQAQQPSSPRITLDDLYGPSGFANDVAQQGSHPTQFSVQSALTQSAQPVQQPRLLTPEGVDNGGQATSQVSPVQNQENLPNVPPVQNVPPTQSTPVQPAVPETPPAPIPDLPTLPAAQPEEPQEQTQQPSPEPPAHEDAIQPNLSLRKQVITEQFASANPPAVQPESPPPTPPDDIPHNDEKDKPKAGMNKLFILRLLFGGIGAIIAIILLFFVVTWLSSLFHPASSGKVTLTYWGLWEDSNTMQSVISEFERQNPNITIQYEKEDPKQYSQRLLTRIQQGNGPDIFTFHSSWLPMVQSALVPLPTSVVSKDDLQNNFYPVVRTDLIKNGALYGIPMEVDTLALFVNNSLFKAQKAEVPTTWDSFGSTARALTQKDGNGKITVAGAALGTFDNVTHAPDILSALFVQNGVDIPTMSPKSNASDALSFYTSFATGDSKVWDSTLDPSQLAFSKGNLAMYFGYSWDVFAIKAANPNLDFSIYPIPHLPGRNTTVASYWVQGVSAKSAHQKEALLFMQFLAQKNTEATLYAEEAKTRLFGEPYARSDLGVTLKSNPLVYPFVNQANEATSSFFAGETQDTGINAQMNGYLGNAVRSVFNNTSADTAIDTLTQGVQQIENQYGSSK